MLIANSNLVPAWATWDDFHELDRKGLIMYGQMTAGSWIYIGSQGIVQGTYETFAECARRHFGGSLKHTLTVTAGLGGMGGAQPLAVTMNEGVVIAVEVDRSRIQRRLETRYLDRMAESLDEAVPPGHGGEGGGETPVHRAFGQCRRSPAGDGLPGNHPGHRHRSDLRPRPPERLHPPGIDAWRRPPRSASPIRKS